MTDNNYFTSRRTVRRFSDRQVDDALVDELLEEAMRAPTTGNMQLYSVVVSRDAEARGRLAKCHFSQPASTGCPVMLTFCVDFNRFEKWCRLGNAKPAYGNLQALMMGLFDAVIFAQQFVTAAEMRGLGTCYLGTTTYNASDIARELELPSRVVPVLTVALGWRGEQPDDCGRLPLDAVRHRERYADYTDEAIARLYHEKESRDDSKGFVEENGKQSLAQVFTDVRYPESTLRPFSKIFAGFLREAGFSLD